MSAACGSSGGTPSAGETKIVTQVSTDTTVEAAAKTCRLPDSVGDGGYSMTIDTEGEEDYSGDTVRNLWCAVRELDVPDYVISRMETTTSLAGIQNADWADLHASWSYHPDNGMSFIVSEDQ
jgi:hypothetical protein